MDCDAKQHQYYLRHYLYRALLYGDRVWIEKDRVCVSGLGSDPHGIKKGLEPYNQFVESLGTSPAVLIYRNLLKGCSNERRGQGTK